MLVFKCVFKCFFNASQVTEFSIVLYIRMHHTCIIQCHNVQAPLLHSYTTSYPRISYLSGYQGRIWLQGDKENVWNSFFLWHNYYPMILLPKYIYSGRNKSLPLDIICCNSRLAIMFYKCYAIFAIYAMCVTEIVPLGLWVNVSEQLTSKHAMVGPTRTLTQAPGCFIVSGCVWKRVCMCASACVPACLQIVHLLLLSIWD